MFEYLREDIQTNREENRALANETNRKIDKLTEMMISHVSDDAKNFKELSERVACIEVVDQTKDRIGEKSWGHFSGWVAMFVAFGTMLVMFFHK